MHAWLCDNPVGVQALRWTELPTPVPAAGQVGIEIHAASLNFPDLLTVQNKYQVKPPLPFVPGCEFSGRVQALGEGVRHLQGRRPRGRHRCQRRLCDACLRRCGPGHAATARFRPRRCGRLRFHLRHLAPRADRPRGTAGRRDGAGTRRRRRRGQRGGADRQGGRRARDRGRIERTQAQLLPRTRCRCGHRPGPRQPARCTQGGDRWQGPRRGLRPGRRRVWPRRRSGPSPGAVATW